MRCVPLRMLATVHRGKNCEVKQLYFKESTWLDYEGDTDAFHSTLAIPLREFPLQGSEAETMMLWGHVLYIGNMNSQKTLLAHWHRITISPMVFWTVMFTCKFSGTFSTFLRSQYSPYILSSLPKVLNEALASEMASQLSPSHCCGQTPRIDNFKGRKASFSFRSFIVWLFGHIAFILWRHSVSW